jgi:hypothetical protein
MGSIPLKIGKISRSIPGSLRLRDPAQSGIVTAAFEGASLMRRAAVTACAVTASAMTFIGLGPSQADSGVSVAIVDFAYVDTSGEPTDQASLHRERLQALMNALKRDFAADARFRLLPLPCAPASCGAETPAALLGSAAAAGVDILVIGGIRKQSTLVQWAKAEAIDVAADRVLLDRLYTFRGDNAEAWNRAEAFLSQDIRAALAVHRGEGDNP